MNSRDSINMYSSLPMVFPAMSHCNDTAIGAKRCSQNQSDDRLTSFCQQDLQKLTARQISIEPKVSYGSHLYTPSRRRKVVDKKFRVYEASQRQVTLFRSSSDGQKKQVNLITEFADMLPVKLKSDCDATFNYEPPPIKLPENLQKEEDNSSHDESKPIVADLDTSPKDEVNHSIDGAVDSNFPGPLPIPVTRDQLVVHKGCSASCRQCNVCKLEGQTLSDIEGECVSAVSTDNGNVSLDAQPLHKSKDDFENDGVISEQLQESNQSTTVQSRMSLQKLSKLFGPEFSAVSGVQIEKVMLLLLSCTN